MFERVKRSGPIARRMEEVCHDHVVCRIRRANKTAGVGDEDFERRLAIGRQVVRLEFAHHLDDFGNQFNAVALQKRMQRRRSEGDARAQTEEQRVTGRRMEQQRDMRMAIFRRGSGRSAHLEPVINPEHAIATRVFNHGHRRHHTLEKARDPRLRRNPEHLKFCRKGEDQPGSPNHKSPAPLGELGQQGQITDPN